jgi:hypothetical protein
MNKQNFQIAAGCTGCGALFAIMLACLATGGVPYFNSEVARWQRNRTEDMANGSDSFLLILDEHAIEENTQYMYGSAGCAACSGLLGLLGLGGAIGLFMRSRSAQA